MGVSTSGGKVSAGKGGLLLGETLGGGAWVGEGVSAEGFVGAVVDVFGVTGAGTSKPNKN